MKTCIVTTCWLGNEEYFRKTFKWLDYYTTSDIHHDHIILLDNASPFNMLLGINNGMFTFTTQRFPEHMPRTSLLQYPYLWRAVHFFQELFKEYDKIIYCDNDAYLFSPKAIEWVNNFEEGWESPWCPRHNFPETGIQVVTNCVKYRNFIDKLPLDDFIQLYNGKMMETTLPITINKELRGDRFSEYGNIYIPEDADFSCQTTLEMKLK